MRNFKNVGIIGHSVLGTTIADVVKMKIEENSVVVKNLQEQIKDMYLEVPKSGKEKRRERRKKERELKNK